MSPGTIKQSGSLSICSESNLIKSLTDPYTILSSLCPNLEQMIALSSSSIDCASFSSISSFSTMILGMSSKNCSDFPAPKYLSCPLFAISFDGFKSSKKSE